VDHAFDVVACHFFLSPFFLPFLEKRKWRKVRGSSCTFLFSSPSLLTEAEVRPWSPSSLPGPAEREPTCCYGSRPSAFCPFFVRQKENAPDHLTLFCRSPPLLFFSFSFDGTVDGRAFREWPPSSRGSQVAVGSLFLFPFLFSPKRRARRKWRPKVGGAGFVSSSFPTP